MKKGTKKNKMTIALLGILIISIFIGTASAAFTGHTGGPDFLGYTYKDSTVAGGPVYNWVEINDTGTQILPYSDDEVVTNIPVGFFFNYYGTDYSHVSISNNGIIFSGPWTGQWWNQQIGSSDPHGFLAPFWDDLVTWDNADAIYYKTEGVTPNKRFIVEWHNNEGYSATPLGISFEAILYEGSNNILFQYKTVNFGDTGYDNGASATVGIESPTGEGLQYSFDEAVLTPELAILFRFPSFTGTNMVISKNAPATKDHGTQMAYNLYYNNFGANLASDVVMVDTLPSNVDYVSSTPLGVYDDTAKTLTWNLGTVDPYPVGRGTVNVIVSIPNTAAIGSSIINRASVTTSTFEERIDDNDVQITTTVTGNDLPDNVGLFPTNSGGATPSVYWQNPITFTYDSCDTATGVDVNIHFNEDGYNINGAMSGGPPHWTYTAAPFYPHHGTVTITYTVYGCDVNTVSFNIYVDPAGYVYDAVTNARIQGAVVTLQRPDGSGGWEAVPTNAVPDPIMRPDTNPLITDINGMYQWDTLSGTYRVHVEAEGYYSADSRIVNVPPPVTDLHVGLTPLPDVEPPTIDSIELYPASTIAGATIDINVGASDNRDVMQVTADNNPLTYSLSDRKWHGSITAASSAGSHTIIIGAKDTSNNEATASAGYTVVTPTGSLGVGISPKTTTASTAGATIGYTVKIKSMQNFDDIIHLTVTTEGLPLNYQTPLSWFNWNEQDVRVPANTQVSVPLSLTIPSGQSAGKRALKVKASSNQWITKAFDTGIITIS